MRCSIISVDFMKFVCDKLGAARFLFSSPFFPGMRFFELGVLFTGRVE